MVQSLSCAMVRWWAISGEQLQVTETPLLLCGNCGILSGYTVNRMIGYGYAEGVVERGVDMDQADWEVNVGGKIHKAEMHKQSLYDPKGGRLHL